jgi:hypothetical protein
MCPYLFHAEEEKNLALTKRGNDGMLYRQDRCCLNHCHEKEVDTTTVKTLLRHFASALLHEKRAALRMDGAFLNRG